MATRLPVVFGADGLLQQLQPSDTIASTAGGTTSATAVSTTLPGGVILKAGSLAVSNGTGTLTFAAAFPTACVSVTGNVYNSAATTTSDYSVTIKSYSTTSVVFDVSTIGGSVLGVAAYTGTVLWKAVGY